METLLIELKHQKARALLLDLEAMNIIRVVKQPTVLPQTIAERFAGKLPAEEGEALQKHIIELRNEWERPI